MKYASVRLVFDRKHEATKEKAALVQIEVLYQRKRKYISTGVKLFAGQWNDRQHVVNRLDAFSLNTRLTAQVASIQSFITQQINEGYSFSFDALEHYLSGQKPKQSFIEFMQQRIEERGDITEHTRKLHRGLVSTLYEFKHIVYFDDITKANIQRFDDWLHSKNYKQTTVHDYHKRLKTYINEAIKYELMMYNPYAQIKISRGKSEGIKYLTIEEVKQIESCDFTENKKIEKVRDLFVFQCYTGLSYTDLAKFDWSDVRKDGGDYIISDTRKKTEENYYIVLLEPALNVLRKYGNRLPMLSNQKYNDHLKEMATMAGIDKPVTSHWARHTFAVMMLSMGARMSNVSRMLGHSSTKITESVYAKVLAEDLRRDYDMINEKLRSGNSSTLDKK